MGRKGIIITEDTIGPMLERLSDEEFKEAKKRALFGGTAILTRGTRAEFRTQHPHTERRSSHGGKPEISSGEMQEYFGQADEWVETMALPAMTGRGNSISGWSRRKIDKEGAWARWTPLYLLDWFQSGTKARYTRGRVVIGYGRRKKGGRKLKRRLGEGSFKGFIYPKNFIPPVITKLSGELESTMGKILAKTIYRIVKKKQ
jgi:hypothetical protein